MDVYAGCGRRIDAKTTSVLGFPSAIEVKHKSDHAPGVSAQTIFVALVESLRGIGRIVPFEIIETQKQRAIDGGLE